MVFVTEFPLHQMLSSVHGRTPSWWARHYYYIRIKSGEKGIPGFSMPGRLGGVICKPSGLLRLHQALLKRSVNVQHKGINEI